MNTQDRKRYYYNIRTGATIMLSHLGAEEFEKYRKGDSYLRLFPYVLDMERFRGICEASLENIRIGSASRNLTKYYQPYKDAILMALKLGDSVEEVKCIIVSAVEKFLLTEFHFPI